MLLEEPGGKEGGGRINAFLQYIHLLTALTNPVLHSALRLLGLLFSS